PSIIRANLRIWSIIREFLGWSKFVSAYVERNKKNFIFSVFMQKRLRIWSTIACEKTKDARLQTQDPFELQISRIFKKAFVIIVFLTIFALKASIFSRL
ncbi:hypothetical protein ACFL1G_11030, partial [Planctomycetota bacterium]